MVKLYYSAVGELGAKIDAEVAPTLLGYLSMRIIEIGPKVNIYCIMYMFLDLLYKEVDHTGTHLDLWSFCAKL